MSENGRSVGMLLTHHELDDHEVDEALSTMPALITADTFRVAPGGGAETSLLDADGISVALGDSGCGAVPESPDAALDGPAGPGRPTRRRWFAPDTDGIDVGLDLLSFGPDADWLAPADSGASAAAEQTVTVRERPRIRRLPLILARWRSWAFPRYRRMKSAT
ncbi:hypothetical protein [Actinoplanes sp. NPDC026623]|uniref:hypothetical protein n=1 Tax=Actinoplanes sp. NPDC026623 TaxID=3155610 RepID=UPI003409294E